MATATSSSAHPLIARLRQLADAEQARREAADRSLAEAERVLQQARQAQRVAAERHAAVLATVEAAEAYAVGLSTDAPEAKVTNAHEEPSPANTRETPSASLTQLVLDAFEPDGDTTLPMFYERVLKARPGTTESGVRAKLSTLHKSGLVKIVRRGVYRLSKNPEEDHTGS
ncbi:hypothetical protein HUF15_31655 [Streptomyces samsunensis]|uniref:hypothetical protein n=1 Tax=Streptomyces malaysiensis TaxID=92644 RepID=UPI0015821476|nr:hypothetical protein [Streptomyces samsunensis]NUH41242.1 hypothetical protein [Streptomyces samsunensis]